ncbi:MAG: hypothetical protein HN816_12930, partial [Gammaproteobacteria bacterium]|nr:hypothetical protein [Gammaproteobacteria bacterium]
HQPDIRIVYTTGYAPDSFHTRFIEDKNLAVIQKPYGTDLLRRQVRAALDGVFDPNSELAQFNKAG